MCVSYMCAYTFHSCIYVTQPFQLTRIECFKKLVQNTSIHEPRTDTWSELTAGSVRGRATTAAQSESPRPTGNANVDFSMLRVLLQSITQQPRICRTKALMMKSLAPAIMAHSHSVATEHVKRCYRARITPQVPALSCYRALR